jgi:redox-sensitive bicupin YhaK (pirin superfamily)
LAIDQDAAIYVSALQAGQEAVHVARPGRRPYLFVIAGELRLNGTPMAQGDQARIADEARLAIRANQDAELILLDLP